MRGVYGEVWFFEGEGLKPWIRIEVDTPSLKAEVMCDNNLIIISIDLILNEYYNMSNLPESARLNSSLQAVGIIGYNNTGFSPI